MLTIQLCTKIYATGSLFWIIIAFGSGFTLNTGELLALIHYLKNDSFHSLTLMVGLAILSVSASVGALQTGFKRGEKITQVQNEILKQMAMSDDLIKNYKNNSAEARNQAAGAARIVAARHGVNGIFQICI